MIHWALRVIYYIGNLQITLPRFWGQTRYQLANVHQLKRYPCCLVRYIQLFKIKVELEEKER